MSGLHQPASLSAALAMIPSLPRPVLSRLVIRMIQRIDDIDGDPDFQQSDGDELDFNDAEDDFCNHSGWGSEAGCPIADPGEEGDHGGGDVGDEGEAEDGRLFPVYGIDQSKGPLPPHAN